MVGRSLKPRVVSEISVGFQDEDEEGDSDGELADIVEDKNLADNLSLDSRPASAHRTPTPRHTVNPTLEALLQQDRKATPIGVEEVGWSNVCWLMFQLHKDLSAF